MNDVKEVKKDEFNKMIAKGLFEEVTIKDLLIALYSGKYELKACLFASAIMLTTFKIPESLTVVYYPMWVLTVITSGLAGGLLLWWYFRTIDRLGKAVTSAVSKGLHAVVKAIRKFNKTKVYPKVRTFMRIVRKIIM